MANTDVGTCVGPHHARYVDLLRPLGPPPETSQEQYERQARQIASDLLEGLHAAIAQVTADHG